MVALVAVIVIIKVNIIIKIIVRVRKILLRLGRISALIRLLGVGFMCAAILLRRLCLVFSAVSANRLDRLISAVILV